MRNLLVYFIIPVTVSLLLMLMYFSGHASLQQIVAPTIPSMQSNSWRELGLLENMQNIYLLIIIALGIACLIKNKSFLERFIAVMIIMISTFIFLEEIDYGLHYYEYFSGIEIENQVPAGQRNWHNKGEGISNVRILRKIVDAASICFFVILPLALHKIRNPIVRYFLPSRWFILTAAAIFSLSQLAHFLEDAGFAVINGVKGNLSSGDISEFGELNMYYGYIVYVYGLVRLKIYECKTTYVLLHHNVKPAQHSTENPYR